MKLKIVLKGGPGSGHAGHGGRPGKRGGSTPGGASGIGAGLGDAWAIRDALKLDKNMTVQHGNWTSVEGRREKGRYSVTVGDTDYTVKIGQSKVYGKGRLRTPSKTKTITYVELTSHKQGKRALSTTLYERSVRGEGGETNVRIGKAVQAAIKYMDRRFGISGIGEYDIAL